MNDKRTKAKQECYADEAVKLVEYDMKNCLTGLTQFIFSTCINIEILFLNPNSY
jgi:hypothetical protein